MKKSFRIFIALMAFLSLSAANFFAQSSTPTVSTASIYIRYCETVYDTVKLTIPTTLLPYHLQDVVLNRDTTVIYRTTRGCDSIVYYDIATNDYYFTVNSDNKKVIFSRGNLQYHAASNVWRFAEHQYTTTGDKNLNISSYSDDWIDLFGYATSGYNKKYPYLASFDCVDYYYDGDISNTNYDWAWYNKIDNGGNVDPANTWYTMPQSEWNYLLNRDNKKGTATVHDVQGLILLPDNWSGSISIFNTSCTSFNNNVYTWQEWSELELLGAVFLPVTGSREKNGSNKMVINNKNCGRYWASSCYYSAESNISCNKYLSHRVRIGVNGDNGMVTIDALPNSGYAAWIGYAVRPVKVVQ